MIIATWRWINQRSTSTGRPWVRPIPAAPSQLVECRRGIGYAWKMVLKFGTTRWLQEKQETCKAKRWQVCQVIPTYPCEFPNVPWPPIIYHHCHQPLSNQQQVSFICSGMLFIMSWGEIRHHQKSGQVGCDMTFDAWATGTSGKAW